LLSSVLCAALTAQDITLEALTISASPLDDTELNTAGAVEVYTAEQIEKAHVQSLYEFISLQTSLFALPAYGNPLAQKLDLHGYGIDNGYQNIVVTLNGRRLNNIDMVPQLLSAIAPETIERLEIVKGGGIVLGGDGANAGAINIVTKTGNGDSVRFYGGTYTTYDGAFRVGHSDNLVTFSASGETYRNGGTRHIDAAQDRDKQALNNGTFDLALTPTAALELRLGIALSRADASYGGALSLQQYEDNPAQPGNGSAAQQQYDTNAYSGGISFAPTSALTLTLDGTIEQKKSDYTVPSWFYESIAHYDYRSATAAADYAKGGLHLTLGASLFDGKRDSGATAYTVANSTSKNNLAAFILAQYRTGAHTFKGGVRCERVDYAYNDIGNDLKQSDTLYGYEAGYNLLLDPQRSLFAEYAHAYQAPDIDRFFNRNFSGQVTFNGFIEPMTSDTLTVGYTSVAQTVKLKVALYYAALHNEIYYYSDPAFVASANTNIDRSHKYGLDLFEAWEPDDLWLLSLNYNYVQAIIDDEVQNGQNFSGNTLPGVSAHTLKAAVTLTPADALSVTLSHTYRSEAYALNDFGNSFSQKQQAYNSTDLAVSYDRKSYALYARISNMFNQANGLWVQDDAIYPVNFTTTAIAGATLRY